MSQHTDQTNPNKTVDLKDDLKMESEEDIYCNLERLLVLLCLKLARRLQTRKKLHHHPNFIKDKHRLNMSSLTKHLQTLPSRDWQPWHTKQTSLFVCVCLVCHALKGIMSRICQLLFVNTTFKVGPSSPCAYDLATGCYVFVKSHPHTLHAVIGWRLHTAQRLMPRNIRNTAR